MRVFDITFSLRPQAIPLAKQLLSGATYKMKNWNQNSRLESNLSRSGNYRQIYGRNELIYYSDVDDIVMLATTSKEIEDICDKSSHNRHQ